MIRGSNTIGEELAPRLIAEFKKDHPNVNFDLEFKGTSYGLGALMVERCDIAAASRNLTTNEMELAKDRSIGINDSEHRHVKHLLDYGLIDRQRTELSDDRNRAAIGVNDQESYSMVVFQPVLYRIMIASEKSEYVDPEEPEIGSIGYMSRHVWRKIFLNASFARFVHRPLKIL